MTALLHDGPWGQDSSPSDKVLATARQAVALGFCPHPASQDGSKKPKGRWKHRQTTRPSPADVKRGHAGSDGLGLICGRISGGLEMFEFEGRALRLLSPFIKALRAEGLGDVWARISDGYSERSPSEGIHVLYRCPTPLPSAKLARRHATDEEKLANPDEKIKVLIESRGEGGFTIIAPSGGKTHPTGKPWVMLTGGLATVATITDEERDGIFAVARTFTEMSDEATPVSRVPTPRPITGDLSPLDEIDAVMSGGEVLIAAGFTPKDESAEGANYVRPGKQTQEGSGATVWKDNGTTTLFSTSIDVPAEFIGDRNLRPSQLHVALNFGGDFQAAAKAWRADHPVDAARCSLSRAQSPVSDMGKPNARPSAAAKLARIAQDRYTFGVSDTGEPYALPLDGPSIVKMLRGTDSLRAELAAAFMAEVGTPPSQQALADALMALEGIAQAAEAEPLAMRVADSRDALWLDLGDDTGELVRIAPEGWSIVSEAPVLHRRTALTGALPRPAADGDLTALWDLLNIAPADRAVLVAFLVAALMPNMSHPVLLLTGEQGTGKSTAAKIIASVVDASPVQLRKPPRDLDSWTTAAVGSHVVAVDNLSSLPDWFSDALCRASTGDGDVRRRLYTDGDLYVVSFRRVVILNGIDLGSVRDDLADRLVTVDLHRIEESTRVKDVDLDRRWQAVAPSILGGLLDLTSRVLAVMPDIHLERSPRMADFAYVLAAIDRLEGSEGLVRYRELVGALAEDAVTGDPVLVALTTIISTPWEGVALDLLTKLDATLGDARQPKDWPSSSRALTTLLKRRAPSLRRLGWIVEQSEEHTRRGKIWQIKPPSEVVTSRDEIGDEQVSSPVVTGLVTGKTPF